MTRIAADLLVIGGGSGGLSVAAGAAQLGAKVVLLEGHRMGGDCLNYGCVPSKALIAAARHAQAMRSGAAFGVAAVAPQVDHAAAMDHVRRSIAAIAPHDSAERFRALGVTVIAAFGRFTGPDEVVAGDAVIRARRIVIATGSRPMVPPVPGLEGVPYLTNETLWDLGAMPGHLLILGGGPIGLEMAQAHRRLGARVTVFEAARALGREDPDAAAVVVDRLRAEGVEIIEGQPVEAVAGRDGAVTVTAGGATWGGTHLLVAAGRVPNVERLDLDLAGIRHEARGIRVDAGLRTTNRRVYAIGDVAGQGQFTHLAGYHAGVVIRSALFGLPAKARGDIIPRVTFTDPELAQAGLTEAEARKAHGSALEVLRWDFAGNDRAIAEGDTLGHIKVMVARGRPVGATIVGTGAGEQIGTWALALSAGLRIGAVAGMVAPYPTRGEISKRAAGQYYVPRLFGNTRVRAVVGLVQRWLP